MSILFNLPEVIAQRGVRTAQAWSFQATERLATGKQINRGADDPSGVIAVGKLDQQIVIAQKKIEGLERSNLYLAAREGGLSAFSDMLLRLQEIATTGANTAGLSDAEMEGLRVEAEEIIRAIDFTANTYTFQGQQILQGFGSSQLGSTMIHPPTRDEASGDDDDARPTRPERPEAVRVGLNGLVVGAFSGELSFEELARGVESAVNQVAGARGAIGTQMRDNESQIRTLMSEFENTSAARSLIEDADYAKEVSERVRAQILEQASISAIDIARQQQTSVLSLIQNATDTGR
ncbi:MAG: hypothetical protein EA378_02425 [Phycisphaerales bacterium]|nr:MAG: hypothetical protein EA378_02425 [Phycisphaerales bacterium]